MAKRKKNNETLDQSFRLKKIAPMTDAQSDCFDSYYEDYNLFLYGCAGTGKTYLSLFLALKEVLNPNSPYRKVYIIRSAVPSRDMGYMPGRLQEKMAVYESPYIAMLNDLFQRGDAYQVAIQKGVFEVISTSFLRGSTFENCILIIDEIQNMNYKEARTVITRCGNNCRVIVCGDTEQDDLYKSKYDTSGMERFMSVISKIKEFEMIKFLPEDIVRGNICKSFILAEIASPAYFVTVANQQHYQTESDFSASLSATTEVS
jgi:phosphate starvation-inducible PhoH-like protein